MSLQCKEISGINVIYCTQYLINILVKTLLYKVALTSVQAC